MAEPRVAVGIRNADAEGIIRGRAVDEPGGLDEFHHRTRLQDPSIEQRLVPSRQVARRHSEFARREKPAASLARGRVKRAESKARVAGGVSVAERLRIEVDGAGHAEGMENAVFKERPERPAGHLLEDSPRDDVVGVAVLPLGARVEVQGLLCPAIENLVRRNRREHKRRHVVERVIVLVAGSVRKQLADRNVIGARKPGQVTHYRVVKPESAFLGKQEDRSGEELLAD